MGKFLGKDLDKVSRVQFLADNCDAVEEKSYMKQFTPEQLQEIKDAYIDSSLEVREIEERKKEVNAEFKAEMEPIKDFLKEATKHLKWKAEFTKEKCYKFVDNDKRMAEYYNAEGDMIESRPANINELQGTIFQMNRTGTNDK